MNFDNIVWIDTETTGVDPEKDRIIELAMVCIVDGERKRWQKRIKPGIPIPASATAIHGITDEDVAACLHFPAYAPHVHRELNNKHIGGYNVRFDLQMIDAELRRSGFKLDIEGVYIIDAMGIFKKREPRDLTAAVRRFCNREHDGAHGALSDVENTIDVFMGELSAYPDLAGQSLEQIADYSRISERKDADLAGKLQYDEQGRLCFAVGQHLR